MEWSFVDRPSRLQRAWLQPCHDNHPLVGARHVATTEDRAEPVTKKAFVDPLSSAFESNAEDMSSSGDFTTIQRQAQYTICQLSNEYSFQQISV